MGHSEDLFYDIKKEIKEYNLQSEFNGELKGLSFEEKFRYSGVRDLWNEAFNRVMRNYKKIKIN